MTPSASADPAAHFLTIFGAIVTCVGAIFLGLGIGLYLMRRRVHNRGVPATGTIISYDLGRSRSSGLTEGTTQAQFPFVAFRTLEGAEIRGRARNGSSPRPGSPGAEISVLYDPDRPERFWAETPGSRRMAGLGTGLCVGIGLIVTLIGVAILSSGG